MAKRPKTTSKTKTLERTQYDEEMLTRGLTELALCAGNTVIAAARLEEAGTPIPRETLRDWATGRRGNHLERYTTIRAEIMPKIHRRIAAECEDRAIAQAQLEEQIEDQLRSMVQHLKPAEAAGALRNLTTSKAINIDKANVLRDKPTAIVEQRNPEQILKQLAQRYQVVDSTAVELEQEH